MSFNVWLVIPAWLAIVLFLGWATGSFAPRKCSVTAPYDIMHIEACVR